MLSFFLFPLLIIFTHGVLSKVFLFCYRFFGDLSIVFSILFLSCRPFFCSSILLSSLSLSFLLFSLFYHLSLVDLLSVPLFYTILVASFLKFLYSIFFSWCLFTLVLCSIIVSLASFLQLFCFILTCFVAFPPFPLFYYRLFCCPFLLFLCSIIFCPYVLPQVSSILLSCFLLSWCPF